MSSIERAMNKMAGIADEPAPVAVPDDAAAAGVPVSETPPVVDLPAAADAAAESKARVVPEAPATSPVSVAPPAAATAPSAPPVPANFSALDFARLAAAGFLTPEQPITRQSEEFQQIKRRLLGNMVPGMMNSPRPPNLILITSSVPGEGKTFTSVNLSISLAMELDHTVLVVDTDVMKRDLSRAFGVLDRKGLFDFLAVPGTRLEDLLVRTNLPNLVILPAGTRREGSTELLASTRMRELADEIALRYSDRVVIFDSPPVLATTTATALAPLTGQLVLVVAAGSTKHEIVGETLQRLDRFSVTGIVLNKAKHTVSTSYDYYGSYYGVR